METRATWSRDATAGMGGFLRRPLVAPDADALHTAKATHAVYGIPFDSTTHFRTGSLHGPHVIRDASEQFLPYHSGLRLAPAPGPRLQTRVTRAYDPGLAGLSAATSPD